MKNNLQTQLRK